MYCNLQWSGELFDFLVVHGCMKETEARQKFRQASTIQAAWLICFDLDLVSSVLFFLLLLYTHITNFSSHFLG